MRALSGVDLTPLPALPDATREAFEQALAQALPGLALPARLLHLLCELATVAEDGARVIEDARAGEIDWPRADETGADLRTLARQLVPVAQLYGEALTACMRQAGWSGPWVAVYRHADSWLAGRGDPLAVAPLREPIVLPSRERGPLLLLGPAGRTRAQCVKQLQAWLHDVRVELAEVKETWTAQDLIARLPDGYTAVVDCAYLGEDLWDDEVDDEPSASKQSRTARG